MALPSRPAGRAPAPQRFPYRHKHRPGADLGVAATQACYRAAAAGRLGLWCSAAPCPRRRTLLPVAWAAAAAAPRPMRGADSVAPGTSMARASCPLSGQQQHHCHLRQHPPPPGGHGDGSSSSARRPAATRLGATSDRASSPRPSITRGGGAKARRGDAAVGASPRDQEAGMAPEAAEGQRRRRRSPSQGAPPGPLSDPDVPAAAAAAPAAKRPKAAAAEQQEPQAAALRVGSSRAAAGGAPGGGLAAPTATRARGGASGVPAAGPAAAGGSGGAAATASAARLRYPGGLRERDWAKLQSFRAFYCVKQGSQPGIYETWDEAQPLVTGFSGALYKKHKTLAEALQYMGWAAGPTSTPAASAAARPLAAQAQRYGGQQRQQPTVAAVRSACTATAAGIGEEEVVMEEDEEEEEEEGEKDVGPGAPGSGVLDFGCLEPPSIDPARTYRLEFDGGSRGNGGIAGFGAVLLDHATGRHIDYIAGSLPAATNNVAEWSALVAGMRAAADHGVRRLVVQGDSELVVRQVSGVYKVRNEQLANMADAVGAMRSRFSCFKAVHTKRAGNAVADELSNIAMDAQSRLAGLQREALRGESLLLGALGLSAADVAVAQRCLQRGGRGSGVAQGAVLASLCGSVRGRRAFEEQLLLTACIQAGLLP